MRWRALLLVCLCAATPALATDSPTLARAIADFDRGQFTTVREQLLRLRDAPSLTDADHATLLKYLGATHHALGEAAKARLVFIDLAERFPQARLDPAVFVPAVVELAERARAEVAQRPDAPMQHGEPRLVPLPAPRPAPSALVWAPFGAGQFANQQPVKGYAFLAAEVTAFAVAGVTLAMLESSKVQSYGLLRGGTFEDTSRAQALNVTSFAAFWTGVAIMGAGVAEAVWTREAKR